MKIYIISNYFHPEIGAASKRITEMALGLCKIGNIIEVVCPMPNYPFGKIYKEYKKKLFLKESYNEIVIRRYWISPSNSNNVILRIWSMISFAFNLFFEIRHLRKFKPDCIIIQHSPLLVSFFGVMLSKKIIHSKVVLNISDLWPLSALELGAIKPGNLYNLLQFMERYNYTNSDLIVGQSNEIIKQVGSVVSKTTFLYYNFPAKIPDFVDHQEKTSITFRIIYAGLLGVAQGVLDIIKYINFKNLGTELHIYGQGNEAEPIAQYISAHPDLGIVNKGILSHEELIKILPQYQAALIPLRIQITGAVPSKIFEAAFAGVPLLFCGGGEGEKIVSSLKLGFTSPPNDIKSLENNICRLTSMSLKEYNLFRQSCRKTSEIYFRFKQQIQDFNLELIRLVK